MSISSRRSTAVLGLSLGVVVASLALAGVSSAKPTAIAQGVRIESTHPIVNHHSEKVHLLRVDLAEPHVHLVAASPGNGVGARRQTVLAMARSRHAIAGINASFFDPLSSAAQPVGGLVIGGYPIKSPLNNRDANLYVTRAGRARIGAVSFTGSITRSATLLKQAATTGIYSINTVADALAGHITLVDRSLRDVSFHKACAVVTGSATGSGSGVITSVFRGLRTLPRRNAKVFSLVACGKGRSAAWLGSQLARGDKVTVSGRLSGGLPSTLVTGGRQLVNNGHRFTDASGPEPYGANPLTFGCVSASGLKVLLGVVDGRSSTSHGMSYAQLTHYLIANLHCYDAVVFDGGGSATMVARAKGHNTLSVVNHPSDGRQRRVATALLVVRR